MIRIAGTSLLAVGFAMLAVALQIYDPAASDANIGAGHFLLESHLDEVAEEIASWHRDTSN